MLKLKNLVVIPDVVAPEGGDFFLMYNPETGPMMSLVTRRLYFVRVIKLSVPLIEKDTFTDSISATARYIRWVTSPKVS